MFGFFSRRTDPTGDAAAVSVVGDGRGVLCLHGLTGTPFEVRPLAEALAGQGHSVEAPLLAGHGRDPVTLAATRWMDWQLSAETALAALAARTGRPVAVVGFSMGGLLALRLARARPDLVAALVVMAAPLRLGAFQTRGIRMLGSLPAALRRRGPLAAIPKLGGADVSDREMQQANPCLRAFPTASLHSLLDLMAEARADLPHVKAPALVVHGRQDHTVPLAASVEISGGLAAAAVVERLWLERSYHLVALDVERATLIAAVSRFFGQHARW